MSKKKIKEATIEAPAKDIKTLKATNAIDKDDVVKIVDDKPLTSTIAETDVDAVIEPQDTETIKYLSNMKDMYTGEVSRPFTINDKQYQMVRGITPSKEVVPAVYCLDDVNEAGDNIIHSVDYFEENIANKAITEDSYDYASAEREYHNKEELMDYLNLADLVGFKHFFVNLDSGDVVGKFKNTVDMVKSGIKLGDREDYMTVKALKRFRLGEYFKNSDNEINEDELSDAADSTNLGKLKSDVKKLTNLIKTKFSIYLNKLDKPIEQAQFLTSMAQEIGVPLNKLSSIINTFKEISKDDVIPVSESKIIKKKDLMESIENSIKPKVIKTIKIKDIK